MNPNIKKAISDYLLFIRKDFKCLRDNNFVYISNNEPIQRNYNPFFCYHTSLICPKCKTQLEIAIKKSISNTKTIQQEQVLICPSCEKVLCNLIPSEKCNNCDYKLICITKGIK